MKNLLKVLLVFCTVFWITACSSDDKTDKVKIGISMPTRTLERWNYDGANLQAGLKDAGYDAFLHFAENNAATQAQQINEMTAAGCEVLIVAPIESAAIRESLSKAKEAGVTIISYDRLIMDSDAVSYYITFRNEDVGTIQGTCIEQALNLKEQEGPFYLELFTGPESDNNVIGFFNGAMDVLTPHIESGKLVIASGESTLEEAATADWSFSVAEERMNRILSTHYTDKQVDAVLASNDDCAKGVSNALLANGYADTHTYPVLTGQDCNIDAVKRIIAGTQTVSVFKDTRKLAAQVVATVDELIAGKTVTTNTTYDNQSIMVPSYELKVDWVNKENYREKLIDSGYYSESQLK